MEKIEEIKIIENNNLDSKVNIPQVLPVVPLRDIVIFPYMMYPILAGRDSTIKAINHALDKEKYLMLVTQIDPKTDEPTQENLYSYGTIARIIQVIRLPNNLIKVLVDGLVQAKAEKFIQNDFLQAEVTYQFQKVEESIELNALIRQTTKLFQDYLNSNRTIAQESLLAYENIKEADRKLYYIASTISVPIDIKQRLLEISDW